MVRAAYWSNYNIKFYAVSRVHLDPPPSHLLKRIIKPTRETSAVAAIQWGIKNESAACEMYIEQAMEAHVNFSYEPAGLYVNHCSPHLEASPDGHISCDCCGEGLIEIKTYIQVPSCGSLHNRWPKFLPEAIWNWAFAVGSQARVLLPGSKVNLPCVKRNTVTLYADLKKDYLWSVYM